MIEKYNFHWQDGFEYNFPQKRELFSRLANEVKTKQIISIIGLRRTGKSTIFKQLIDHLIGTEKVRRNNIIFYSFDEEQPNMGDLLQEYESKTGKNLLKAKERIYIFLDEVQKLENWQNQIKYYYDNYANLKFFISGSTSLFIKKQVRESLAGRIYEFVLNPLSFREFLVFRGQKELIEKKNMLSDAIKKEFLLYQKRQFIEIIEESEEKTGQYIQTMIEKVVYQDIPKSFPIEYEELLLKILKITASNPGMLSDYESLSKDLGIGRVTLSNYFFYLEESFLIKKLYNFSKNQLTSEKKMKKFYLSSTSFFPFLNPGADESKLIENLIVASANAKFFWRTPQKYEVDCVLIENGGIVPVEVKYQNNISEKDLKNILRFCETFGIERALLITKDTAEEKEFILKSGKKVNIKYVPAWEYLLDMRD